ncbi:hypothetical protein OIU74_027481 [Salix koriyanagi]|uniref:UspA domain-containing protein n=1 Tax=Salix koriyanagi TaxID=2511006 RepID=A0A9Q0ZZU5_9ROSI|nr:hypothetical protein OIU74_027481 [Salix koriyanagi]
MGKARTFGIGMDYSPTSKASLRWAAENLVEEGDRIILIHVQPPQADHSRKQLFEETGSRRLIIQKQYGLTHDAEVHEILDTVSKTKGAKVVAKIYWGDAREKLIDAVDDLKLDSLVIGSRGLGAIKRVLLGSVSDYVVTNASCPVTVVKVSKP